MISLDSNHVYHDESGVEIPGVTTVLKDVGLIDTTWFTKYARDRGTAVHLACALYDRDDLDESSIHPDVEPYLQGWIRFKRESGFVPELIEEKVRSETYGYAGTLDRTGMLNGRRVLLDLKSGAPQPWTAIQTAAYSGCFGHLLKRYAVAVKDNGSYQLTEYRDRNDWQVWLACLALRNWKHNGGVK